jgi:Fe-S-cluster containining protein
VEEFEIIEMAKVLNLSVEDFSRKYIRKVNGQYSLTEDPKTFDCVFLKDNKCTIYSARPQQCQAFPWWVQNLRCKEDWDNAAAYCEGINHPDAPKVPFETIQANLKSLPNEF